MKFYFYPRPPGGGRPASFFVMAVNDLYFYPRPPGGGRLNLAFDVSEGSEDFYPRPPGGGRQRKPSHKRKDGKISIHALRVEGDYNISVERARTQKFLSTPSGWRATFDLREPTAAPEIFLSTPSGWRATLPAKVPLYTAA